MRKLLVLAMFLSVSVIASADKNIKFHTSQRTYTYAVSDISKLTFSLDSIMNVFFTNGSNSVSYPYYNEGTILGISFDGYTGVENVWDTDSDVSVNYNSESEELIVDSANDIVSVCIYSSSGSLVMEDNSKVLYVSALTDGVYIVKVTTSVSVMTQKIVKR